MSKPKQIEKLKERRLKRLKERIIREYEEKKRLKFKIKIFKTLASFFIFVWVFCIIYSAIFRLTLILLGLNVGYWLCLMWWIFSDELERLEKIWVMKYEAD